MFEPAHSATCFEYRRWTVSINVEAAGGLFGWHADLGMEGCHRCRMALATPCSDAETAYWALDSKARDLVDEWTSRPRPKVLDSHTVR